jgi:hypothetical protein
MVFTIRRIYAPKLPDSGVLVSFEFGFPAYVDNRRGMRFLQTRFFGQKEQVVRSAGTGRMSRALNP